MRIALDYDGTYTEDPDFWDAVIALAQKRGHEVVCVTMRHDDDLERVDMPVPVIYTGRQAKVPFMANRAEKISVWIDDSPRWLLNNG